MNIKILLVDDNSLVRYAYKKLLSRDSRYKVVGEAEDGLSAIEQCNELNPDLIIMDVAMPGRDGIDVTREIIRSCPEQKILIISAHATSEYVYSAMKAGAAGYIPQQGTLQELREGVESVIAGNQYLSKSLPFPVRLCADEQAEKSPMSKLSSREKQVVKMIADGMAHSAIAEVLKVNVKTVATYKWRAMCKLEVQNVQELIRFAIRHNIISM
jgi:two-component system response regulator NreC